MPGADTRHLQTEPDARVMVFIDGQNLYKRCEALFGHPLCHPNLLTDPQNGHRRFTPDELGAFQRAEDLKRAMSIGTDSAGGFLVPTHLDASIILSNAGVVDPIRDLASVTTIGSDTWNGITSAEWKAEAAEMSDASPDARATLDPRSLRRRLFARKLRSDGRH